MKIFHVITHLDRYGSEEVTLWSCIGQLRRGHEVTLATGYALGAEAPLLPKAEAEGLHLVRLPALVGAVHPLKDLRALWACYRLIRKGNFDIVHTHTSKAGVIGRLAAHWAGNRRVVHEPHYHLFYGYLNPFFTRLAIWVDRFMARFTDTIITSVDSEADEHLAVGVGRREQFLTKFNGIPLSENPRAISSNERIERRKSTGIPPGGFLIASVGRLEPSKDHGTLIRALPEVLSRHPETHLVLMGDGTKRNGYERLAEELGVRDKISFLGWREDVPDLLEIMDLFVLPSVNEQMSLAALHAMAAGLAVVATNVGGLPEMVEDGRTGLLVPARDPQALSAAVNRLLARPDELRAMGRAGRERSGRFGVEVMWDRLESIYRQLLDSPRS